MAKYAVSNLPIYNGEYRNDNWQWLSRMELITSVMLGYAISAFGQLDDNDVQFCRTYGYYTALVAE